MIHPLLGGLGLWVNSETLRRVGYHAATPEPAGGQIVRCADGSKHRSGPGS